MKSKFLLIIIYLAFISLGLPDGSYGVSWPTMRIEFNKPLEMAGVIGLILTICSAISSFFSGKLQSIFGTGKIVLVSCLLTGFSLVGFSIAPSFIFILLLVLPLGFGQGGVDSSLNNYVAKHYSSRHMNWLHSFWGFGASLGPFIITIVLSVGYPWRMGYIIIGLIQLFIAFLLMITLKNWKTNNINNSTKKSFKKNKNIDKLNSIPAILGIIVFFVYAGIEFSIGLWTYSMFVESRNIPKGTAGIWVTFYYTSLTVGRFLSGIVVSKIGNRNIVRTGFLISSIGTLFVFLNTINIINLTGLILIGIGFAPLYPCMIHEVPKRFSPNVSETLIGYQVGAAMLGASIIPACMGFLLSNTSLELLIPTIFVILLTMFSMSEYQNKLT